jgi:tetratricopeptide (TPR) repeat protein
MMDPNEAKTIVAQAEELKKSGDLYFGRADYDEAIKTYNEVLKQLQPLEGTPFGEVCSIRCLANQAQCYLKKDKFEEAAATCDLALSIASIFGEPHLLTKIFRRRAVANEQLNKLPQTLASIDSAIRFGDDSEDIMMFRERIFKIISEKEESFVALPPPPDKITPETVAVIITLILKTKCDVEPVTAAIMSEIIDKRASIDARDTQGNNVLWAVCQAAVMRASTPGLAADDVLPVLELIIENGGRANQRFAAGGFNRTPLQLLAISGAVECLELMIRAGANVKLSDNQGWTALEVACSPDNPRHPSKGSSNHEVVSALLARGASPVHKIFGSGMTAISLASQSGDGESVLCLIKAGAVINSRCTIGFSPIVWAMIGNGPKPLKENSAVGVLLHFASNCGVAQLQDEMKEDMKCFHLAAMLHELKKVRDGVKQQLESEGSTTPVLSSPALFEKIVKIIETRLGVQQGPSAQTEGKSRSAADDANVMFKLCMNLMPNFIPRILMRRWGVKAETADKTDVLAAFGNAFNIERCWAAVVMASVSGVVNPKLFLTFDSKLSPFRFSNEEKFAVLACYDDFMTLIRGPITMTYSPFVPVPPVLELMAESRFLVEKGDLNGYWSKLLRTFSYKGKGDTENYCQVQSFNENARCEFSPVEVEGILDIPAKPATPENKDEPEVPPINVVASPDAPALIFFSEPNYVCGETDDRDLAATSAARVDELNKLCAMYPNSKTLFLIGQYNKSEAAAEMGKNGISYHVGLAVGGAVKSNGYTPMREMLIPHWPFEEAYVSVWQK